MNLPFPAGPALRVAELSPSPVFESVKAFRPHRVVELEAFQPNVIMGTSADLQALAEQVDLNALDLACVDHAVLVITPCGSAPLDDVTRVVLWQTFGVPVYEVYAGLDNTVLAYECELHEGWHLNRAVRFTDHAGELILDAPGISGLQTGMSGTLTADECPCGRAGFRLLAVERVIPAAKKHDHATQLAAIA